MNKTDFALHSNLTFKTRSYRKNFDLISENDNIVTECDGNVSILRIAEKKPPFIIGEYGFSVWNLKIGEILNVDMNELINDYSIGDTYSELLKVIKNNDIYIGKYKKLVLVHSFIVRAEYRKHGITEEFIEYLYREYYDENTLIIALVKPFQNNLIDNDYFLNRKSIRAIITNSDFEKIDEIPASEYYSLNDLYKKEDIEYNEYKLFSVVAKCGFSRIGDSYLFKFDPEIILKRMITKINEFKELCL